MGTNVGMMAVQVAATLKAEPVFLVGFDYSAPMANYNHPNTAYVWNIYPDMTRFWSVEKMDYLYIKKHNMAKMDTGRDGQPVYTIQGMMDGRIQMGHYLKSLNLQRSFYTCSKHGVAMDGVDYRPLADLLGPAYADMHKRPLQPSQHSIPDDLLTRTCETKKRQVKKYFNLLKEINRKSQDVLHALENHATGPAFSLLVQAFYNSVNSIQQGGDLSWIEATMVELDRRLRHLLAVEKVAREDSAGDMEKIRRMMEFFQEQYKILSSYEGFFQHYLDKVGGGA